jgi:uncharacterized phage protein gp47/JayE
VTDFSAFFPLFGKSEDDIYGEMAARAHAGLTPDDPDYVDTRVGSPFWLATRPMAVATAEAYSRMNEAAAAGILGTSWGTYLDNNGASFGQTRKPALAATGVETFTGDAGTVIGAGVEVGMIQTDPDIEPPTFVTVESGTIPGAVGATGTLALAIQCVVEGTAGNVAAHQITQLLSGVPGVDSVDNAAATAGGVEEESDEAYKARLLQLFKGQGDGTAADYERWALEEPGVGRVTVVPLWAGPGTVQVIIMDELGRAVAGSIVTSLQNRLDPVPGQGAGQAPISHEVTVQTPTEVLINVTATVTFQPGYSYDAITGTIAMRTSLERAVRAYIDGLQAGDDVIYNHVRAALFIPGVLDVTALQIGIQGSAMGTTDIAISSNPAQVAVSNTVTFS